MGNTLSSKKANLTLDLLEDSTANSPISGGMHMPYYLVKIYFADGTVMVDVEHDVNTWFAVLDVVQKRAVAVRTRECPIMSLTVVQSDIIEYERHKLMYPEGEFCYE